MNNRPKMEITIEVQSEKEKMDIGNRIHEQLKGNTDYIENNIVLNIDEPFVVRLWIFEECKIIPKITI